MMFLNVSNPRVCLKIVGNSSFQGFDSYINNRAFLNLSTLNTGYMATGETGIQTIVLHELTSWVVWKQLKSTLSYSAINRFTNLNSMGITAVSLIFKFNSKMFNQNYFGICNNLLSL